MAWSGVIAFEVVLTPTYFTFDVYSAPLDMGFFGVTSTLPLCCWCLVWAGPLLVWALKKPIGWLVTVLHS